jgi:uncharacterized membrane protein HdeD (DUF308 family)
MKPSTRLIVMGAIMAALGALALLFASATTLAAVIFLGGVLLIAGVAQVAYAIQGRKYGDLWPHLGLGVLFIACSVLIARNPIANTLGFTLAIGFLLTATGLVKVISAFVERATGWGWIAASGLISLLLAAMILSTFPVSAIWTIGTLVGADLLFTGLSFIGMGTTMKEVRNRIDKTFASNVDIEKENFRYETENRNRKDRGSQPTMHH